MTHWEVISKSNLFAGGILFWRGGTRDDGWFLDPSRYLQTARFDGTFHFHCNQHDRDHHLQYCFGWMLWDLAVMILSGEDGAEMGITCIQLQKRVYKVEEGGRRSILFQGSFLLGFWNVTETSPSWCGAWPPRPLPTVILQLEVGPRGKKCKMVTELLDAKSVPWRWCRFLLCVLEWWEMDFLLDDGHV